MKTAKDFQEAWQKMRHRKWTVHECSLCGYPCGYYFTEAGEVWYDSGCECVKHENYRPSSWEEVAAHYNIQTNESYVERMNSFWGFQLKLPLVLPGLNDGPIFEIKNETNKL